MTASNTSMWRPPRFGLLLIWLGLFSVPCHALTLGDLAVSSRPSPNFTASLPFSDDKTVRLSALQTRIATDAEYAQWGMQTPNEIRQLRIRVVPASKTVGYIELYSLTPLAQGEFDLLIWASYAGQTILTQYKVVLLDVPSLIKGKTLSASLSPAEPRRTQASSTSPKNIPNVSVAAQQQLLTPSSLPAPETATDTAVTPAVNSSPAAKQPEAFKVNEAMPTGTTVQDQVSTSEAAAINTKTSQMPVLSDETLRISGIVSTCALVLFVFGFLLGKRRNNVGNPLRREVQSPKGIIKAENSFYPHRPVPPKSPKGATIQGMAPSEPSHAPHQPTPVATSPAAQDTSAASNGSQEISGFEIMPASGPSLKPTSVMTAASRMPATALPTPRLMPDKHLSKKSLKSKSMANEHIDLAKIYLSMGDPGTAQMVLQQVIEEGTEAEKSIASHLMQQMV